MKILMVVPLFPPDSGVSTLRANFFYEKLDILHSVDILKLGKSTNLDSKIKTIDKKLFSTFFTTIASKYKIKSILKSFLQKYDCVIVSAPPYNLYIIGNISSSFGIPTIYDYRDQPDLIYYEKIKNKFWNIPIRWLLLKGIEKYIYKSFENAFAVFCAGRTSTLLVQNKLKNFKNIYNFANGFLEEDIQMVSNFHQVDEKLDEIVIGWGGSVYDFRDTNELRLILKKLDDLSILKNIKLYHWGSLSKNLKSYIDSLKNLKYIQQENLLRKSYLQELSKVDVFLLACSDSLIWEPTTTVYDYILFDKPVIYCGLHNNEAFYTLQLSQTQIILHYNLDLNTINEKKKCKNTICLNMFSREFQYSLFESVLKKLEMDNHE